MFLARQFCPFTFILWQRSSQSKELPVIQGAGTVCGSTCSTYHPRADTRRAANVGSALQRTARSWCPGILRETGSF